MSRPLRIEYTGAIYHITSRGNARQNIYDNDADRKAFLALLAVVCRRYHWVCQSYCLLSHQYLLMIETQAPSLSKGMKYLNGGYTQYYNRAHGRVGHVFQGRFKAILVEREAYLLELCRYIVLNPVRAQMVRAAKDWPWSSYRALAGLAEPVEALSLDWVWANFARRRAKAVAAYRAFVADGKGQPSPWQRLKNQIYLGSDNFVDEAQCKIKPGQSLISIPKPQKLSAPKPLGDFVEGFERNEGMARAYLSGHYTLVAVGVAFGVSYGTVGRAVKVFEAR